VKTRKPSIEVARPP